MNYEAMALDYFINQLESDSVFDNACDCASYRYDKKRYLMIYDSSYIDAEPDLVFDLFEFDSSAQSDIEFVDVDVDINLDNPRLKFTSDPQNFSQTHYLVRFSSRFRIGNETIIELNIKPEKRCSGINYLFHFDQNHKIESFEQVVWCDSPG